MRIEIVTNQFKKDLKKSFQRGLKIKKLFDLIEFIKKDGSAPKKNRPHKLKGNFKNTLECHIEPDWLLIYQVNKKEIILIRTGTHADLF